MSHYLFSLILRLRGFQADIYRSFMLSIDQQKSEKVFGDRGGPELLFGVLNPTLLSEIAPRLRTSKKSLVKSLTLHSLISFITANPSVLQQIDLDRLRIVLGPNAFIGFLDVLGLPLACVPTNSRETLVNYFYFDRKKPLDAASLVARTIAELQRRAIEESEFTVTANGQEVLPLIDLDTKVCGAWSARKVLKHVIKKQNINLMIETIHRFTQAFAGVCPEGKTDLVYMTGGWEGGAEILRHPDWDRMEEGEKQRRQRLATEASLRMFASMIQLMRERNNETGRPMSQFALNESLKLETAFSACLAAYAPQYAQLQNSLFERFAPASESSKFKNLLESTQAQTTSANHLRNFRSHPLLEDYRYATVVNFLSESIAQIPALHAKVLKSNLDNSPILSSPQAVNLHKKIPSSLPYAPSPAEVASNIEKATGVSFGVSFSLLPPGWISALRVSPVPGAACDDLLTLYDGPSSLNETVASMGGDSVSRRVLHHLGATDAIWEEQKRTMDVLNQQQRRKKSRLLTVAERWASERQSEIQREAYLTEEGGDHADQELLDKWDGEFFTKSFETEKLYSLLEKERRNFLFKASGLETSFNLSAKPIPSSPDSSSTAYAKQEDLEEDRIVVGKGDSSAKPNTASTSNKSEFQVYLPRFVSAQAQKERCERDTTAVLDGDAAARLAMPGVSTEFILDKSVSPIDIQQAQDELDKMDLERTDRRRELLRLAEETAASTGRVITEVDLVYSEEFNPGSKALFDTHTGKVLLQEEDKSKLAPLAQSFIKEINFDSVNQKLKNQLHTEDNSPIPHGLNNSQTADWYANAVRNALKKSLHETSVHTLAMSNSGSTKVNEPPNDHNRNEISDLGSGIKVCLHRELKNAQSGLEHLTWLDLDPSRRIKSRRNAQRVDLDKTGIEDTSYEDSSQAALDKQDATAELLGFKGERVERIRRGKAVVGNIPPEFAAVSHVVRNQGSNSQPIRYQSSKLRTPEEQLAADPDASNLVFSSVLPLSHVHMISNLDELKVVKRYFEENNVDAVGIDCEWSDPCPVSILSLATPSHVFLFDIALRFDSFVKEVASLMRNILADREILKVMFAHQVDLRRLALAFDKAEKDERFDYSSLSQQSEGVSKDGGMESIDDFQIADISVVNNLIELRDLRTEEIISETPNIPLDIKLMNAIDRALELHNFDAVAFLRRFRSALSIRTLGEVQSSNAYEDLIAECRQNQSLEVPEEFCSLVRSLVDPSASNFFDGSTNNQTLNKHRVHYFSRLTLASLCEATLGLNLDKRQRTSEWNLRPLSEEQKMYAARDAHVLLLIEAALRRKGLQPSIRGVSGVETAPGVTLVSTDRMDEEVLAMSLMEEYEASERHLPFRALGKEDSWLQRVMENRVERGKIQIDLNRHVPKRHREDRQDEDMQKGTRPSKKLQSGKFNDLDVFKNEKYFSKKNKEGKL